MKLSQVLDNPALFRSQAYINGLWCDSSDGKVLDVTDPGNGESIGEMASVGVIESMASVNAAQAAFAQWSRALPQTRGDILRRWHDLLLANKEDLARIMVLEQGKPISEARGEIDYACSFIDFYAEEAKRANIESVTSHLPNAEVELWREPVGVAALITPWNFPCAMITRKAAAALAAGCTVVIHPSAETPFSATALAALAEQSGFPAGVFNVVPGEAPVIVGEWVKDCRVRALSFTGSTEVGRLLYRQSSDTVKHLILELGGLAPFIVFADCDIDVAVDEAVKAKFATSGQDCLGANRILVERAVYQEFCEKFVKRAETLTLGYGLDDPDLGPLMNARAVSKQDEQVQDAVTRGAQLATGGKLKEEGTLLYLPTVLIDVPRDARIMHEETFGPVAAIAPFDNEQEVEEIANATEYGLVAYLHTQSPSRIYRLSRSLQYGMVAVNRTKITGAPIPFGGMKQSGLGREGGRSGMESFMNIKYICRDWS
ncbi:NAD-dependent succinate-semialdehyde dehydrogenase [Granulosicoccus antarcticus]|uniref:Succinate-semialdehyde dehydrogenase [NADP(+)] GabD n=1 Tax=Granulosicoccus antarcticus IMCC3135 TaxID=1192854 RepID=A0A2Z2NLM8_9GAMM|nr:NAD-dependent succinate-semialdehyde dehydrogenase [Granulosicoccus antarcticus]ASJ72063.1 Succinate-semialdehyde dehydrogenase [NADP(+)] GabD [Granulosicoccus antarcticus IMCC3135]